MLNDHDSGLSAAAWRLLQETQARHLFITLEKRGLVVFERRSQDRRSPEWAGRLKSEQLPSLADHALDRLGCGDALLATATLSLTAGSPSYSSLASHSSSGIVVPWLIAATRRGFESHRPS